MKGFNKETPNLMIHQQK